MTVAAFGQLNLEEAPPSSPPSPSQSFDRCKNLKLINEDTSGENNESELTAAPLGQLNLVEVPLSATRSVDCYEKLEQIGEGSYGQVYMAKDIKTGQIVALKRVQMEKTTEGFPLTAIREIKILNRLNHENVIKLKEIVTSQGPEGDDEVLCESHKYGGSIYLVFEYMDHDLTGLLDRPGLRFTVPQIKCYMRQLLTGLHYCHLNKVVHRDIQGPNLLLDNKGSLKLADFGVACMFSDNDLTNRVITVPYRPPELLFGATKYGPAVDIWSAGCIFAELLHGKPVMRGRNEPHQLYKIFELCGTPDEMNWPGVSKLRFYDNFKPARPKKRRIREVFGHFGKNALDLLEKMLTLDPSKRISAKDALDAEYFRTEPLPCDPKSLPKYESSHVFQTMKKRQQQRKNEEIAKKHKLQHPPTHTRLPPVRPDRQHIPEVQPQINPPIRPVPPYPYPYLNPRGEVGLPIGYMPPHVGGHYGGPYFPPGSGTVFAGTSMPLTVQCAAGSSYAVGPPGFPPGGHFGGVGGVQGPNPIVNNLTQQYGWKQ